MVYGSEVCLRWIIKEEILKGWANNRESETKKLLKHLDF